MTDKWLRCRLAYRPDADYRVAFKVMFLDYFGRKFRLYTNPDRVSYEDKCHPLGLPYECQGLFRVTVDIDNGITSCIRLGVTATNGQLDANVLSSNLQQNPFMPKQTQCILRRM